MALEHRFEGTEGRRRLREELLAQHTLQGDAAVAAALARVGKLRSFATGEDLIREGDEANSIFFLLVGVVSILIHGRRIGERRSHQHVGEMALIDASARRSATVRAVEETIALEVDEAAFTRVASQHPELWRRLAVELAARLRSRQVRPVNAVPVLLVVSSSEAHPVARQLQESLHAEDLVVRLWTDNVFKPGLGTLESLSAAVDQADLGVAVYTPDDQVICRGVAHDAARDNVIFELGLCVGALGRERAYMLRPRGVDLKIPTDYLGVTALEYPLPGEQGLAAALDPSSRELREAVRRLGPR